MIIIVFPSVVLLKFFLTSSLFTFFVLNSFFLCYMRLLFSILYFPLSILTCHSDGYKASEVPLHEFIMNPAALPVLNRDVLL